LNESKYHQGKFTPRNPEKYIGDIKNIIYRSSWEFHFLSYCDKNKNVVRYSSEEIVIPYVSPRDNKVHRYFPDFYVELITDSGIRKMIIEIKPDSQTRPPRNRKCKTKKQSVRLLEDHMTFEVNRAKWAAAKEFCDKQNIEFRVLTEKELFNKP